MIKFIQIVLRYLKDVIGIPVRQALLSFRFPTCNIYPGVVVTKGSRLGRHNVLFRNVSIINSSVGDHTFIQKNSIACNATIGKFCSIAEGVVIGLGQHPMSLVSTHPAFYSATQPLAKSFCDKDACTPFQQIEIGHDVWIGHGALIRDGIRIGTGSVIGAGSVVTKNVPEYGVVAGVPARLIKYRFDEAMRNKLLDTKWWNRSDEWLHAHVELFSSPECLVSLHSRDKDQ